MERQRRIPHTAALARAHARAHVAARLGLHLSFTSIGTVRVAAERHKLLMAVGAWPNGEHCAEYSACLGPILLTVEGRACEDARAGDGRHSNVHPTTARVP